ncbi:MAG: NADH-quinone oxidoreductase subunit N [Proteobacteria bacterium]|nr:NADH-quinone oxidoreductase subunit N [Pseudomonadota bacterium]
MKLHLLLPEIILFCGALTILVSDAFLRKKFEDIFYSSHFLALLFSAASLLLAINNFSIIDNGFNNGLVSNLFTSFVKIITLLLLIFTILISLDFVYSVKKISAELLALMMISTAGSMILVSANDFLTFYLGLELQALPLYLLASMNRGSKKSSEAGIKYFILGCLASGLLLFGISLIYGFSGTINFESLNFIYHGFANEKNTIPVAVMFGFILVVIAMFFKVSAAPFHMWTPDVYEGSATAVTTFFATVIKFATAMVLLRLVTTVLLGWEGVGKIFAFVALLSILIGSFGAIFQKNFKRLLAYSSIGHVGFFLLGVASFGRETMAACMLYMLIYAVISIGTFAFLNLMKGDDEEKVFDISSLSGLAKTNPTMAFSLSVLMFSTAGIPPLAGFFSKFYIITFSISYGLLPFAIAAIVISVAAAYYYLRIVKIMYFDESNGVMQIEDIGNVKLIVLLSALINIGLVIFVNPLLSLLKNFL